MNINPIVFIDDDVEDLALMTEMAGTICHPNPVVAFDKPEVALDYLKALKIAPLFILSDINMPKISGFELRGEMMSMSPDIKEAPFIFLSTSGSEQDISHSKELNITKFYKKAYSFAGMRETLENIMLMLKTAPGA